MTQKEKHALLAKAYVTKEVSDDRKEIEVINDELPKEFSEAIRDIQFKLNESTGIFELDYPIMSMACSLLADVGFEELKDTDLVELSNDCASVYTNTRLSYINVNNQQEISDVLREYGNDVDIATACAVWYERQVIIALDLLLDFILK